jgi:hypothetical protein
LGKRSSFKRIEKDFYETPREAVFPLLPYITHIRRFAEPCAGSGKLIKWLTYESLYASWCSDIERDARTYQYPIMEFDCFITNPPWSRDILHPIIHNLSSQAPTWLLFDADWMHTKQSVELMKRCRKIVSVGRIKWIPDSPYTGKDNCCWYLFDAIEDLSTDPTEFYGR